MRDALLEREFELDALERALTDVAAGRAGVTVLDAAAGLGKTALIRHARERAAQRQLTALSARGSDLESPFAFGVVRQLFEAVLPEPGAERDRLFAGAARAAEGLFAAGTDEPRSSSQHLLRNGLYWLLVNLAETRPVVVLVDDLQWVDRPSAAFLGFLARRVDGGTVGLVVGCRTVGVQHDESLDEILAAGEVTLLEPKGLTRTGVAELVRHTFGRPGCDEFVDACHEVTGGNPLFLRELLRILTANGVGPDAAGAADARATGPDAVRRHVVTTLRRRPPAVRDVARVVAVMGDGADPALVARHSGLPLPAIAAAVEQLTSDGVLGRADPPTFVHPVVREVVLDSIPRSERSAQHERAAAVLREAGRSTTRIAGHLLHTAAAHDPERVTVLLSAAEQARRHGSPASSARYLLRARAEPPPVELRSEVSRLLGNCEAHDLALDDAERHLREACSLATTHPQRALCAYSLARFSSACGAPGRAVALLSDAMRELSQWSEAGAVAVLTAQLEAELLGVARADLTARQVLLEHLGGYRVRPDAEQAVTGVQQAAEALFAGEPAATAAVLTLTALTGGPLPPDRSAIWVAVHTLIVTDRLDEAGSVLDAARDTSVRRGLAFPTSLVEGYLARVAHLRGELAEAEEHLRTGSRGVRAPNGALPVLEATRINLLVEAGRLTEAEEALRDGPLPTGRAPDTVWQLWLLDARARLHAARGDAARLHADALIGERLYAQWGAADLLEMPWRLYAAAARCQWGDRDHARHLVDEHLAIARRFGVARYIAQGLRTLATLQDSTDEVRKPLEEAVDLLDGPTTRLELGRSLEQLGTTLLREGDTPAGVAVLERALQIAGECHAEAMTERLRSRLVSSGRRPPSVRETGVQGFTPSERQIARLAARGLTNREIAEQMFLSEKTIEAHLSRAYRKVNVRSRTQLAARLAGLERASGG